MIDWRLERHSEQLSRISRENVFDRRLAIGERVTDGRTDGRKRTGKRINDLSVGCTRTKGCDIGCWKIYIRS